MFQASSGSHNPVTTQSGVRHTTWTAFGVSGGAAQNGQGIGIMSGLSLCASQWPMP